MYESDKEQLEALSRWWKENGRTVIAGLVIGIGGVAGWTSWQTYVRTQEERASAAYQQLVGTLSENPARAPDHEQAEALMRGYPDTDYAALSALLLADHAVARGDGVEAERYLKWSAEHGTEPELRELAKMRLAQLMFNGDDLDAALALLDEIAAGTFAVVSSELRGDILVAKGDVQGAALAYGAALVMAPDQEPVRARLQMKIDDLGVTGAGNGGT